MPNIKSAKKRMRQADGRRDQNRQQRSRLRNAVKKVREASTRGEAEAAFKQAERLLDRAAQKHLIDKNNAARNKQRLAKVLSAKKK